MKLRKSYRWACLSLALGLLSVGSAFARDGGVSGGGGGIAPADPAGSAKIEQALRESRLALTLYFKSRQLSEAENPTPTGRLLFQGPVSIFDLVDKAPIETKGTCRDPKGKRRDGAAPGKRPGSVCMDVKSLGRKLTLENYWPQTIALLGHELSHLLGTNERQAQELQAAILAELRYERSYSAISRKNSVMMDLDIARHAVEMAQHAAFDSEPAVFLKMWQNASAKVEELRPELFSRNLPLRVTNEEELWLGRAIYRKVQLLTAAAYARINDGVNAPYYQQQLHDAFRGKTVASQREVEKRLSGANLPVTIPDREILLVNDEAAYRREASSTLALFDELRAEVGELPPGSVPLVDKDQSADQGNSVYWSTNRVNMSARDFLLTVNGEKFEGKGQITRLASDPGDSDYWTLEVTWLENGKEMSLYLYFEADAHHWWIREIRTSNGEASSEGIYYYGNYLRTPLGRAFQGDLTFSGFNKEGEVGILEFRNLSLLPLQP